MCIATRRSLHQNSRAARIHHEQIGVLVTFGGSKPDRENDITTDTKPHTYLLPSCRGALLCFVSY